MNDEEGRVGARKVGELAAEGVNVGYWQASQKSEGISRDSAIYQAAKNYVATRRSVWSIGLV